MSNRYEALDDSDTITVKHENTGLGWVALAIILAAMIISGHLS